MADGNPEGALENARAYATALLPGANSTDLVARVLRDTFARQPPPEEMPVVAFVNESIEFLKAHYDEDLTLEQLSAMAHVTRFHFLRRFQMVVGETPMAYLQRYRIERAKEMLVSTSRSVRSIASAVGYSSPSSFSRAFLRIAAISPNAYRMMKTRVSQQVESEIGVVRAAGT